MSKGFSFMELVVVIGILALLSLITFQLFRTFTSAESLMKDARQVVSELNKAQSLTLSSKDADQYGVHLETSRITLFKGALYISTSTTNISSTLSPLVRISPISLAGGGSDVIFQRLTGETTQTGTITLSLVSSASTTKCGKENAPTK